MKVLNLNFIFFTFILCLIFFSLSPNVMKAQQDDVEGARNLRRYFEKKREENKIQKSTSPIKSKNKSKIPKNEFVEKQLIGLTIWRLKQQEISKEIENVNENRLSYISESINPKEVLKQGEMIRLTIEIPQSGYLYCIDSEEYLDGTKNPVLIFPTKKIRNGNNRIEVGQIIGLPDLTGQPPYFKLNIKKGQIAENLSIIITDQPIEWLLAEETAQQLSPEQFAKLKAWETQTKQLVLETPGRYQTSKEQDIENTLDKRSLDLEDPPPQTALIIPKKPTQPVMVTLSLRLESGSIPLNRSQK